MHIYPSGVSDNVVELCNAEYTIASALASSPAPQSTPCHSVWEQLYPKPFVLKRLVSRFTIKHDLYHGRGDPTKEDLDRAERCGKFPYRPSDLFLKIYSDVLLCLERDPLAGVCSPPLMGTSAVMPLTIISVIPDIMQHYYDCIVRAQDEVILATNYWQPSNSVDKIANALRELSKRHGKRRAFDSTLEPLVVKIMWDRGQLSQAIDNHAMVDQAGREALKLPKLAEIPHLTLEVINFHRPIMGTFHAKFLIIDRKVALLNSNNIQDRPNLEMMIHLEGPVVESFYDIFLYSWHHKLTPLLPCLVKPPPTPGKTADDYAFGEENPYLSDIELVKAAKAARAMLRMERVDDDRLAREAGESHTGQGPFNPFPGQGRLHNMLGGFADSRRASFADGEGRVLARQKTQPDDGRPKVGFADAVFKAMETRRKSLVSGVTGGHKAPAHAEDLPVNGHTVTTSNHDHAAEGSNQTARTQDTEAVTPTLSTHASQISRPTDNRHHIRIAEENPALGAESSTRGETDTAEAGPETHTSPETNNRISATHPGSTFGTSTSQDVNGDLPGRPRVSDPSLLPLSAQAENPSPAQHAQSSSNLASNDGALSALDRSMFPTDGTPPPSSLEGEKTVARGSTLSGTSGSATPKKGLLGGLAMSSTKSRSGSIRSLKNGAANGPPEDHTPRQRALSTVLNAGALSEAWSTVEDADSLDEFNPHTLHKKHDPFPIAMVCRKPHGLPGHQDIRVPQDAAWLAGFRYAQRSVFIQTPTFNAKPVVAAAIDACKRGIQVTIYVDLGFNDKGESMPFQGGTNEEVVERMYKQLNKTGHQKNLHVYWYTGKDQVRPLNAVLKQRNCHVKFMQIDDTVGIQGNGNQDTQSWYHSCEVNVMVDSKEIVGDWMAALRRQQNTELYGRVDDDGIWRDPATGKTVAELEQYEKRQAASAPVAAASTPKRSSSRLSFGQRSSQQVSTASLNSGGIGSSSRASNNKGHANGMDDSPRAGTPAGNSTV